MPNLIGTAPDQVPVNGFLGNMAFQNKEGVVVDLLSTTTLSVSGNVGIGTTTPKVRLQVTSATTADPPTLGVASGTAYFTNNNDAYGLLTGLRGNGDAWLQAQRTDATATAYNILLNPSGGNVGIGITSPAYKLHVASTSGYVSAFKGTTAANSGILVGNTAGDTSVQTLASGDGFIFSDTGKYLAFGANGASEKMRITAAGDVGIGTSSPGARLVVSDAGTGFVSFAPANASTSLVMRLGYNTDYSQITADSFGGNLLIGADESNTKANSFIAFRTDATERMRVDNVGNVGIGTSAPAARLHVVNSVIGNQFRIQDNTTDSTAKYGTATFGHYTNAQAGILGLGAAALSASNTIYIGGGFGTLNAATAIQFFTAANNTTLTGTERMRIDASGQVGIGVTPMTTGANGNLLQIGNPTTSAGSGLTVGSTTTADIQFSDATTGAGQYAGLIRYSHSTDHMALWTASAERMRIDNVGNVGIGTSSPSGKLQINGNFLRIDQSGSNAAFLGNAADLITGAPAGAGLRFDGTALRIAASSTEIAQFTSGGNFGIGTSSPSFRLQVETDTNANAGAFIRNSNTGTAASGNLTVASLVGNILIRAHSAANSVWPNSTLISSDSGFTGGLNIAQAGANPILLWTNGSERMRITSAGDVGIGTTTPQGRLEVASADAITSLWVDTQNAGVSASNYSQVILADNNALRSWWRNVRDGSGKTAFGYNNHLAFLSGASDNVGTERMRIDASGNLGIGNSAPGYRLVVNASGTGTNLVSTFTTNVTGSYLGFFDGTTTDRPLVGAVGDNFVVRTAVGEAARIDSSGRMLVGRTSALNNGTIEALGTARQAFVGQVTNNANSLFQGFNAAGTATFYATGSGDVFLNSITALGTGPLTIGVNGAERVRISASGQLLVGTTTTSPNVPTGSIEFVGGAHLSSGTYGRLWRAGQAIGSATYAGLYGMASTYNAYYNAGWKSIGGGTASAITIDEGIYSFSNSNTVGAADAALTWTTRMTIGTSGNVGIGTTSPAGRLAVSSATGNAGFNYGTSASPERANLWYDTDGTGWKFNIGKVQSGTFTTQMTFQDNGNVGIGTSSPGALLQLNKASGAADLRLSVGGTLYANIYASSSDVSVLSITAIPLIFGTNNTERARISAAGGFSVGTTTDAGVGNILASGNVTAYSDIRVKDNVEQITGALGRVQRIRGVTYTRTDLEDTERRYAGVIAQEIEEVLPEAIFDSGELKAVDYNATIGLLIEAIKELTARVAQLEGK
jgi:hypothetical protein